MGRLTASSCPSSVSEASFSGDMHGGKCVRLLTVAMVFRQQHRHAAWRRTGARWLVGISALVATYEVAMHSALPHPTARLPHAYAQHRHGASGYRHQEVLYRVACELASVPRRKRHGDFHGGGNVLDLIVPAAVYTLSSTAWALNPMLSMRNVWQVLLCLKSRSTHLTDANTSGPLV